MSAQVSTEYMDFMMNVSNKLTKVKENIISNYGRYFQMSLM